MKILFKRILQFVWVVPCFLFLVSSSSLAAERLNLRQHLESFVNFGAEYFSKHANKEQVYKEFSSNSH